MNDHESGSVSVNSFDGIHAYTAADLIEQVTGYSAGRPWVISDVSLGAWRANWIASEFLLQLNAPPPGDSTVLAELASRRVPSYADIIAAGIDGEGRGSASVLNASRLAKLIAENVSKSAYETFAIILPRFGMAWNAEEFQFVSFLSESLKNDGRVLLITSDPNPSVPDDWTVRWISNKPSALTSSPGGMLSLVPGIVDQKMVAALNREGEDPTLTVPLRNDLFLIAPECRRAPVDISRLDFDRLAISADSFKYLGSYAQYYGNNLYVDLPFLCSQAWSCYAAGAADLSQRLLKRATDCAPNPEKRGLFSAYLQGMSIAQGRFGEVADYPDPSTNFPPALRSFLLQAKGWGLVMSGQPERAIKYLQDARAIWADTRGREYLYLLNIVALAQLKSGNPEMALELEKQVEEGIAELSPTDWHLKYVNALNLARLYRRSGQLDSAESYYDLAFSITRGMRSEGDLIYTNVCRAKLLAQKGAWEKSLKAWIRAALHWMAAHTPQAISARFVRAIVPNLPERADEVVRVVSDSLVREITEAIRKARPQTPFSSEEGYPDGSARFFRIEAMSEKASYCCAIGGNGWSLLQTKKDKEGIDLRDSHSQLDRLLLHWLRQECKQPVPHDAVFVIDDCFGQDIATTEAAMLGMCIRHRTEKLIFEGVTYQLDQQAIEEMEMELVVEHSPAVNFTKGPAGELTAGFRRYRSPRPLSFDEMQLVICLEGGMTVRRLIEKNRNALSRERVLSLLRLLERDRVLSLSVNEVVCDMAGINLLSSAN